MSGFVERLIARTLGRGDLLRPRTQMLFERLEPAAGDWIGAEGETRATVSSDPPSRPAARLEGSEPGPAVRTPPASVALERLARAATESSASVSALPPGVSPLGRGRDANAPPTRDAPPPEHAPPSMANPALSPIVASLPRLSPPGRPRARDVAAAVEDESTATARPLEHPRLPFLPAPPTGPWRPADRSRPPLPAAFLHAGPASRPAAKAEPTVEITIGRLEVRAVTASPSPRERTPPATASDGVRLKEYLRRRWRGEGA